MWGHSEDEKRARIKRGGPEGEGVKKEQQKREREKGNKGRGRAKEFPEPNRKDG